MGVFPPPAWDITRQVLTKMMFIDSGGVTWAYAPALLLIPVIIFGGLIMRLDSLKTLDLHPGKSFTLAFIVVEFLVIFLFAADNTSPFIYFQF